jgi:hypothetical protein
MITGRRGYGRLFMSGNFNTKKLPVFAIVLLASCLSCKQFKQLFPLPKEYNYNDLKPALITAKDMQLLTKSKLYTEQCEEYEGDSDADSTEYEYTFDSGKNSANTGTLFITSLAEIYSTESDAQFYYSVKMNLGLKLFAPKGTTVREDKSAPALGDDNFYAEVITDDGDPLGYLILIRKKERHFYLTAASSREISRKKIYGLVAKKFNLFLTIQPGEK